MAIHGWDARPTDPRLLRSRYDLVWDVVRNKIPRLKKAIEDVLAKENAPDKKRKPPRRNPRVRA
jgi:hypothetical protein